MYREKELGVQVESFPGPKRLAAARDTGSPNASYFITASLTVSLEDHYWPGAKIRPASASIATRKLRNMIVAAAA